MSRVIVAENAGFCFGVKRAADKIEEALRSDRDEQIFTLGHLIHNPTYNEWLKKNGVSSVEVGGIESLAKRASSEKKVSSASRRKNA